jgi:hypothetical protein
MVNRTDTMGEHARRQSNTDKLREFFLARPGAWVSARDLEFAGRQAWRTRVSEVRRRLQKDGLGTIECRVDTQFGLPVASWYRFLPHTPLGRDAGSITAQRGLF